jgi:hypothetical protein
MIKEQRVQLKEYDKACNAIVRKVFKENGFRSISNSIYKTSNSYFIHANYNVGLYENNYTFSIDLYIKKYNYDDIFWGVLDMGENTNGKISLRANGAFRSPSIPVTDKKYNIKNFANLDEMIRLALDDVNYEIDHFFETMIKEYGDFNKLVLAQSDILDEKLLKMIANIDCREYGVAKKFAKHELSEGRDGRFQNNGKGIYEYIVEYCSKKE